MYCYNNLIGFAPLPPSNLMRWKESNESNWWDIAAAITHFIKWLNQLLSSIIQFVVALRAFQFILIWFHSAAWVRHSIIIKIEFHWLKKCKQSNSILNLFLPLRCASETNGIEMNWINDWNEEEIAKAITHSIHSRWIHFNHSSLPSLREARNSF